MAGNERAAYDSIPGHAVEKVAKIGTGPEMVKKRAESKAIIHSFSVPGTPG